MNKDKPTVEDIRDDLYPKCVEYYSPVQTVFKEDERYYELDFADRLQIPDEFKKEGVILPTARDMVDTFVDHIDISNARVFVNRKGTSNLSMEEAEMMRKFYLGIIHRNNVESDISPWRVGAKHYALHGLTVFEDVWDADNWLDKPTRKDGESENDYAIRIDEWRSDTHESIPIRIRAINPHNIIPDPSYGGRGFVFKITPKIVMDIKQRYTKWTNPKKRKLSEKVDLISYWDNKYRCDLVDGEPLLQTKDGIVEHKYGFIPYVFIDSGLGNMSVDGDLSMRYVGILRYIYDLCVAESRDFSISDIILKRAAWPWLTAEGTNAGQVTKLDQKYGVVNPLPKDVKIEEHVSQVPPDALNAHMYRTADYISAHAAPRSLRGLGETGVRSGADRRLMISEGAARFQYSETAFRNGTAKVLTNCARLMKNVIPGDIRVWARTPTDEFDVEIKKDKMKEPFTCYVEFAPISEEDEYRRHDDSERLVSSGIVTRQWARTQMSNVDPIKMERDEERERIKNDPAILTAISQYTAGKMAEALAKRSAAESINNPPPPVVPGSMAPGAMPGGPPQAPQQAGRGLVPPIPAVAPLGSGQDLQNKLAQQRSQVSINPNQGQGGGGNRP